MNHTSCNNRITWKNLAHQRSTTSQYPYDLPMSSMAQTASRATATVIVFFSANPEKQAVYVKVHFRVFNVVI
eukprot:1348635-Amorphochlora_amoeboformis.AAC.1